MLNFGTFQKFTFGSLLNVYVSWLLLSAPLSYFSHTSSLWTIWKLHRTICVVNVSSKVNLHSTSKSAILPSSGRSHDRHCSKRIFKNDRALWDIPIIEIEQQILQNNHFDWIPWRPCRLAPWSSCRSYATARPGTYICPAYKSPLPQLLLPTSATEGGIPLPLSSCCLYPCSCLCGISPRLL